MKIAILGSAPSSLHLAPFGDPSWEIWGCSPGVYPKARRVNAWFELHRWEPGVAGIPESQKPWFSPEYVQWMGNLQCPVWMQEPVPEIPRSVALPTKHLVEKFGNYFFTSSIAFMIACAIEDILDRREKDKALGKDKAQDVIGLWGVDMAATEEYGYQRAGCQHFLLLAAEVGIEIFVPPESDLLCPMPLYGISESSHFMIKNTARLRELEGRRNEATAAVQHAQTSVAFLNGAIDDVKYQLQTWGETRDGMSVHTDILAQSPRLRERIEGEIIEEHMKPPAVHTTQGNLEAGGAMKEITAGPWVQATERQGNVIGQMLDQSKAAAELGKENRGFRGKKAQALLKQVIADERAQKREAWPSTQARRKKKG